jgi:hypothetical protein
MDLSEWAPYIGKEKAMLLMQEQYLLCYDALQHFFNCVEEHNGSPDSRSCVVPFSWLPQGNCVAVAECSAMVRKIDADLKEGLKERKKKAFKTLQNEIGNAITACCLETV